MNFQINKFNQGSLRFVQLDHGKWYHAGDACELLGVINDNKALALLPDDTRLACDGVELVNGAGLIQLDKIARNDRAAIHMLLSLVRPNQERFH